MAQLQFPAYKIRVVEEIKVTSRQQRAKLLTDNHYNLFSIRAEDIMLDFLTDSGTGALSAKQSAAMQVGDESYAGSRSWFRFHAAVQRLFPFEYIIPTHQGRAAERILFSVVGGQGKVVPNNTHFDTTRANIESTGAVALDLPEKKYLHLAHYPFKGNMDVAALQQLLEEQAAHVPLVMMTLTNNSGGGQPVSMENLYCVKATCKAFNVPLYLDACRFAENAWFIQQREKGYHSKSIVDIVKEMASLADGMTMSAKKDGLAHIGGWLATNDSHLAEKCTTNLILTEGFPTYGGLSGRDLEIIAQGLTEVVTEDYLSERVSQVQYLGLELAQRGIPVIQPIGGHAVYIDAAKILPHIPPLSYPGQAFAVELYLEGGIRCCEIGSVMFGRQPDGSEKPAPMELVRLAIPRRTYTQAHMDYAIDVISRVASRAAAIQGMRITREQESLRHFTACFEPCQDMNNNDHKFDMMTTI